jgi:hypothetical protein
MGEVSMAVVTGSRPTTGRRDLRDRDWFPLVAALGIVVVLCLVVTRVVRHDVVTGWQVLATCAAPADAVVPSVSASLDTSECSAAPADADQGRGWPVVAALLPASAGEQPDITRVRADKTAHTVVLDYRPSGATSSTARIVFVEVPPGSLPDTPVTVTSSSQR